MNNTDKLRTLIVTVQNKPGVLFKIAGLIRRRQFNIDSLTVSRTENPEVSRFTIVVHANQRMVEQISKQLLRIMEVLAVQDPPETGIVARELALIKVTAASEVTKEEAVLVAQEHRARQLHVQQDWIMFEMTGTEEAVDAFYQDMRKFSVIEFIRTGRTALFT